MREAHDSEYHPMLLHYSSHFNQHQQHIITIAFRKNLSSGDQLVSTKSLQILKKKQKKKNNAHSAHGQ